MEEIKWFFQCSSLQIKAAAIISPSLLTKVNESEPEELG